MAVVVVGAVADIAGYVPPVAAGSGGGAAAAHFEFRGLVLGLVFGVLLFGVEVVRLKYVCAGRASDRMCMFGGQSRCG